MTPKAPGNALASVVPACRERTIPLKFAEVGEESITTRRRSLLPVVASTDEVSANSAGSPVLTLPRLGAVTMASTWPTKLVSEANATVFSFSLVSRLRTSNTLLRKDRS